LIYTLFLGEKVLLQLSVEIIGRQNNDADQSDLSMMPASPGHVPHQKIRIFTLLSQTARIRNVQTKWILARRPSFHLLLTDQPLRD
jgi:hypothetical protein